MTIEQCYRILELPPGAPVEDVKRAHRDLTKVWHPDRFANDPALRVRAEEKLKEINEAYSRIVERRFARGPATAPVANVVGRVWLIAAILAAGFVLLRRPTLGGLVLAVVVFLVIALIGRASPLKSKS